MKFVFVPLAIYKSNPNTIAPMNFARETYIKKLVMNGLSPLFVSVAESEDMIRVKYEMSNGVLLMGGGDLNSNLYGKEKESLTNDTEHERDLLEVNVAQWAMIDRKPLLGICRGCQVIAVAQGGSLVQHVERHRLGDNMTYDQLPQSTHEIEVDEDSVAFEFLEHKKRLQVNSAHHQAVEHAGRDMKVVGRANDGVVEIIEHVDRNYFCVGVQSHPEAAELGSLDGIFKAFVKAVLK